MGELPEETLRRFQMMERSLSAEHGPFALFGVFLRENSPNRWDIVASAEWVESASHNARTAFLRRLQDEFSLEEQILVSQVALLPPQGAQWEASVRRIERAVRAATGSSQLEHGLVEMQNVDLFGQTIDHAYILTAQPLSVPAAV